MNKNKVIFKHDDAVVSDYEKNRYSLLIHNFTFNRILQDLRIYLGKKLSGKEMRHLKEFPETYHKPEFGIQNVIEKTAHLFDVEPYFIVTSVFDKPTVRGLKNILMVGDQATTYFPGLYVRFHPLMSKDEWDDLYKNAQVWTRKAKVLYLLLKENQKLLSRKQIGYKDSEQNLKIYIEIEGRIPKFWKKSSLGFLNDHAGTDRKIKIPVLEGAIEETVLFFDDVISKQKRTSYRNIYYGVASRYQLPRLQDLPLYTSKFQQFAS